MHIDRLARTLENSQGMVHGRKGKAVSLKSTEQPAVFRIRTAIEAPLGSCC